MMTDASARSGMAPMSPAAVRRPSLSFYEISFRCGLLVLVLFTLNAFLWIYTGAGNYDLSATESANARYYSLVRQLLFLLSLLYLAIAWIGRARLGRLVVIGAPMLAITAFALVSIRWAPSPVDSLRAWMTFAMQTTTAMLICLDQSRERVIARMRWLAIGFIVVTILFTAGFHHLALQTEGIGFEGAYKNALRGVLVSKNTFGGVMPALLTFIAASCWRNGRFRPGWVNAGALFAGLALVGLSQSATGMLAAALIALFAVKPVMQRIRSKSGRMVAVTLLALLAIAAAINAQTVFELATASVGRNATLTGRSDLWSFAILQGEKKFWLGYGFAGFWDSAVGDSGLLALQGLWQVNEAHNGFIEAFLWGGMIGLALTVLLLGYVLVRSIARMVTAPAEPYPLIALILVLQCIAGNVSESGFPQPARITGLILFVVMVLLAPDPKRTSRRRPTIDESDWRSPRPRLAADARPANG